MADSGINWDDDWTNLTTAATSAWSGIHRADATSGITPAIDLDGKYCAKISVELIEDNTGAIDSTVTLSLFGDIDGTNYEERTVGNPFGFKILPVQADTVRTAITVLSAEYPKFKFELFNDSGQDLETNCRIKYGTILPAS